MMFAHGFGCDQNMWRLVAPAFAGTHRVVLFDHVGAGHSDTAAYDFGKYRHLTGSTLRLLQDEVREIAVTMVCPRGRLPVLLNSVLVRDPDGTPTSVRIAVFLALDRRSYETELLRARQRAEESEARARVLARTLQDSLLP